MCNKKSPLRRGWTFCCLSGRMLFSAQFVCLCYGRDDVREDVFFAEFLCKSYFVKVCKDIVVYAAEDDLYAVFLLAFPQATQVVKSC